MTTQSIAFTAGSLLAAAALCWTALDPGAAPPSGPLVPVASAESGAPTSGRPSPLLTTAALPAAPAPRITPVRHVKPLPLVTCEEFWQTVQPIFDTLPHMNKADIHKLGYFCPADFNKDDQVDDQDLALFGATWNDETSPLFNWCDMNHDGVIDDSDAIEFLHQYREGPRNCEELRDLRSTIC